MKEITAAVSVTAIGVFKVLNCLCQFVLEVTEVNTKFAHSSLLSLLLICQGKKLYEELNLGSILNMYITGLPVSYFTHTSPLVHSSVQGCPLSPVCGM